MRSITTDVVVVGASAAGLLAAATARRRGCEVIVIESTPLLGGSTASASGELWLPGNHLLAEEGRAETAAQARRHIDAVVGAPSPGSTVERRDAFVAGAPLVARWLSDLGLGLTSTGQPDHHPDAPSSRAWGRSLECDVADTAVLGEWRERCRFEPGAPVKASEAPALARSLASLSSVARAVEVVATRSVAGRLRGRRPVAGGAALVTGLLREVLDSGVGLWLESEMTGLVQNEEGTVEGVTMVRNDIEMLVQARRGVILAAGGFEQNAAMREKHLPQPTSIEWTLNSPGNDGVVLRAASEAGAGTTGMSTAWWEPVAQLGSQTHDLRWERSLPHAILVDGSGRRFTNEAAPGVRVGAAIHARHTDSGNAVPTHLVFDQRHRRRYPLGSFPPGLTPRAALQSQELVRAGSIPELAKALGVDQAGLVASVARFNGLAARGTDTDFGRGNSVADRHWGDPRSRPHPNLGTLEQAPFWGVPVFPGDRGTTGGVLTDPDGRVLRGDGTPITGLYAAGGCTASLWHGVDPGEGAALAEHCVFAQRAAVHASPRPRPALVPPSTVG